MIGLLLRSARDFWSESLLLMVFNLAFAVCSLPGLVLSSYAAVRRDLLLAAVGVGLLAPWPFASLGLFGAAAETVAGRPLSLSTFFRRGRLTVGVAYRWGLVTLLVLLVLLANVAFYFDPRAPLAGRGIAGFLAGLFLLLALVFAAAQAPLLGALAIHPGIPLRSGIRHVGRAFVRRPFRLAGLALMSLLFFGAGVAILPLGLLLAFSWVAVLNCRAMAEILTPGESPRGSSAVSKAPD